MPYILKQYKNNSSGIITLTHNEALWGVAANSRRVKSYLQKTSREGKWIYGVHIQGDCSHLGSWPLEEWQSFLMWPDTKAKFLSNIPPHQILPLNCINFMPEFVDFGEIHKIYDICIISRPTRIKRIMETLYLIRALMDIRPGLKSVFIVPDTRNIAFGNNTYQIQDIRRDFFELPRKIFSAQELKNISFICSSQLSFGNFPISSDLMNDILRKSRFLLLFSHSEGVPRVLAEALLQGTPCIVSKSLRCGILPHLNKSNSIFIEDDIDKGSQQIIDGLDHYNNFSVDKLKIKEEFCASRHLKSLRDYLSGLISDRGKPVEGKWYLEDLHLRLSCHGQKNNFQFMNNENLFFSWINKIKDLDVYDEDIIFGTQIKKDKRRRLFSLARLIRYLKKGI